MKDKKVLIVWAWWIWSMTTYFLAQMWVENITVVDYDSVETHNVSSQFYKTWQEERGKVYALYDNILDFTWELISYSPYRIQSIDWLNSYDIIIMAVDNMDTRKYICENANPKMKIIDWRMRWEYFEIFTFDPQLQKDRYMRTWFSDEQWTEWACTEKSVSYNTWCIWAFMAKIVRDIMCWVFVPFEIQMDIRNLELIKS